MPANSTSSPTRHSFTTPDGIRLSYLDAGEGESVVLLHEYGSDSELQWVESGIFDRLAEQYRVLALDIRGHGQSDKPSDPDAYSGDVLARDPISLLDHLDLETACLVGYSMGGQIGLKTLELSQERWRRAVFGATGWMRPGDDSHQLWTDPVVKSDSVQSGESNITEQEEACLRIMGDVAHGMRSMIVSPQALRKIRVPTLLIVGENDSIKSSSERLKKTMPRAEIRGIKKFGREDCFKSPSFVEESLCFLERFEFDWVDNFTESFGVTKILVRSVSRASPLLDRFSGWLLGGFSAIVAFLAGNIQKIAQAVSFPGLGELLYFLVAAMVLGLIQKYFAMRIAIYGEAFDAGQFLGKDMGNSNIRLLAVELENSLPRMMKYIAKRDIESLRKGDISNLGRTVARFYQWQALSSFFLLLSVISAIIFFAINLEA